MRYVLGPYTLDTQAGELRHGGAMVPLGPKAYQVLVYLIEQRHRLVTKTELLDQVWPNVYVDDSAVSRCIIAIRRALEHSSETQPAIQTRRGYGYRFVAPVVCQEPPAPPTTAPPALPLPHEALQAPLPPAPAVTPPEPVGLSPPSWDTPGGERKVVTVLCCRLHTTAATADSLDLDAQHAMLQTVFALLTPEVRRYGGTIQPLLGEGFLALFGVPTAYEDHAQRAVLAAIGLRHRWQTQGAEAGMAVRQALTLHLGVHTGLMVIGEPGGVALPLYTAGGDTATLAARLAQGTVPGSIALSAATARLVAQTVHLEALRPEQTTSSGALPVPAYRVLGAVPQGALLARRENRVLTPFGGRERELTTLHQLLAQVEQGRGQVVGLVGEQGIGKSRLLYEFRRSIAGHRVTYLTGRCVSYGSTTPYLPIVDLVRHSCGITETDAPESIRAKLQQSLHEVGTAPDTWTAGLCQLLGVHDDTTTVARLSPEAFKRHVHEALQQLSLHGSRQQPLVCAIEDLHWIDPSSEEYLTALVERLPGAALLLLVTYRPGYRPPWIDRSYATQMALQPLAPEVSQRTLARLLQPHPDAAALLPVILAKAKGNPFFLEELARAAVAHETTPSL